MSFVSDRWEAQAKALPTGQKTKIPCCATDSSALISNSRKGINYYCFRCKTHIFKAHGQRSAAEILEARNAVAEIRQLRRIPKRCVALYADGVPREAILWVLTSGLTPEIATDTYGMLYDPKSRRVNIPITGGFLARAVFRESPKYIKAGADTETYVLSDDTTDLVVICEDIMSTIKVHRAGFNSISILGTAITPVVANLLATYKTIVCWTDGDNAGDGAWVTMRKRMALYPVRLLRVRTDEDPKKINAADIRQIIGKKLYE